MIVDVVMPKLGESITEGTILNWKKKEGDFIKKDETLLEVSTDKVDVEIPSPTSGIVKEILFKEKETVEVGKIIARIEVSSEEREVKKSEEVKKETKLKDEEKVISTKEEPAVPKSRFYSPLILTIAKENNIGMEELERIPGTGMGGRLTKKDLLNYIEEKGKKEEKIPIQQPAPGEREIIIPMDHIRKKIAEHMRRSLDTSAHVYTLTECDMSKVIQTIQREKEKFLQEEKIKLTFTPFFIYASIKALKDFPKVNASIDGENIILKKNINIGIAVATERGLIVPVIKNAEAKSFLGITREAYNLAVRAREEKLSPDDIFGSTFTITNYGVFGNIFGLPIINQPNVAILGVGAVKKRPVVIETAEGDTIGIRPIALLSLSFDHRLLDGDIAGQFLERIKQYLENFDYAQA